MYVCEVTVRLEFVREPSDDEADLIGEDIERGLVGRALGRDRVYSAAGVHCNAADVTGWQEVKP